ncbi:MAG: MFS transporter [Luteibacter sp.]
MSSTPPAPVLLMRHRAFLQFWFARNASSFGFQMMSVAVGWQIYAMTGRALDLGLIGLVQFVPSVLLALPAGHVADQFDRRRIVTLCQTIEWIAIALLAVLSLSGHLNEAGILALVFVVGIGKAFEFPALASMLPAIVPAHVLPRAMASTSAAGQAAMIAGPALGGLLYVAGPATVYGVSALLYLVALVLMSRLSYDHTPPRREPATLKTVFAGVHFIRHRPAVFGVISLDLFAVLLGGATALLPIFAQEILHVDASGLGVMRSMPALGAAAMAVWLATRPLTRNAGPRLFVAVAVFGLATVGFGLSTNFWLSLLCLFVLGAADMVSVVVRQTLVQADTPDAMRGRVAAVNTVFIGASNELGEFESGILAALVGAVSAVVIGGLGTLGVAFLWGRLFPDLRRRDRLIEG